MHFNIALMSSSYSTVFHPPKNSLFSSLNYLFFPNSEIDDLNILGGGHCEGEIIFKENYKPLNSLEINLFEHKLLRIKLTN